MILCLDIGNTMTCGGVFKDGELHLKFRFTTRHNASSDELGIFLRGFLRENGVRYQEIEHVALCCVVPAVLYSMRSCCLKYLNSDPFILRAGAKTGLKIKYSNPLEVGADRIANAIAATSQFPDQNIVIVDLGTATTLCAVSKKKEYLGGTIIAGLKLSVEALESGTAQLPSVAIVKPKHALGRSTVEGIQSGLYFGTLGVIRELVHQITEEAFGGKRPLVIGTSGFSGLFQDTDVFDVTISDLVLQGVRLAFEMNQDSRSAKV